ncbi:NADP-dependent oxidoreductase [Microvirga pakistanensis]|uniref:NADP-dependent oxidoreductase n=1 Tax=Microvirga pakistanensis TaxID=1682650 RepID=UPI0010698724|nr:NADP-dependent oxidoreductase [Microvirga pakistanensis]
MKAIRIHRFGGPEVLTLDDVPWPQPKDDEVLVRVHAASVNPVDYKIRGGSYSVKEDQLPYTLGRDLSGTVELLGTRAHTLKAGDPIFAFIGMDRGAYAEYVVVKAMEMAAKPDSLDHVQAAAVPLAGLTAWQGLFDHGHLQAGQRVLIHGGAGGVGHLAVQFAKAKGADVLTTASGSDLDFVHGLGADEVIDYEAERFEDRVSDVDLVFDLVSGDTQDRSWGVLKEGGILVSTLGQPPAGKAAQHNVQATGYRAQPNPAQLSEIGRLIDDGQVRVVVDRIFPLTEAGVAQDYLEQEHVRGKVVLRVSDET